MPLTVAEREAFLAQPHVAALSVDGGEGRAPLSVPIWYAYEPGGELWIVTGRESRKARHIAAAGRFTMLVDVVQPVPRYVSVEGPVTATEPGSLAEHSTLAHRYLPPEEAEAYLAMAQQELVGDEVVIRMRPEHWLSADLGQQE